MTDVLCFGDSNTWGYNPKDGSRFSWEIRWTGRLQKELQGDGIRVLEEGLCGRTTIFAEKVWRVFWNRPGSVHQRAKYWSFHRSIWASGCGRTALTPNFHRNPWKYQSGSVMSMRRSPTDTEPHSFALLIT